MNMAAYTLRVPCGDIQGVALKQLTVNNKNIDLVP